MQYKTGKLPAQPSPKDFKLVAVATGLPAYHSLPSRFGNGTMFADWGMLGNDRVGDCVEAGAGHETMLYNKRAGHPVAFSTPWVIQDYSAAAGYVPGDESTDNGTLVRDYYSYRRKSGVHDAHGIQHKIVAYVQIDPKDWELMMVAVYVFGAVGIGFEFPDTAMKQFNDGTRWDVVPGAQIEGGHYVCGVGTMARTKRLTLVTWARRFEMTRAFYETYNDETWVPLSAETIDANGKGPHGVDLTALKAELAAL